MRTARLFHLIAAIEVFACCVLPPKPDTPDTKDPDVSHCDALKGILDRYKLECLELPGFIATGVYGPRAYPNENTTESGFNGEVPPGLISEHDGGTISKKAHSSRTLKASVGISLNQFFRWLPDTKIAASSDDTIDIDVTLSDLKIRLIQDLQHHVRPIIDSRSVDPRTQSVRAMVEKLCKNDTAISTVILTASTSISVSSRSHSALSSNLGWTMAGFNVDNSKANEGSVTISSKKPIAFATQFRESEPLIHDLCVLTPCSNANQRCCWGGVCGAGLICQNDTCIPRPNPILSSARVTWHTTGDNKDWNTQPVVMVFDGAGRVAAQIACCSSATQSDDWQNGRVETRDMDLPSPRATMADLAHGHIEATRNPVRNDDWDYTAEVELRFSPEDPPSRHTCSGRNSCGCRW